MFWGIILQNLKKFTNLTKKCKLFYFLLEGVDVAAEGLVGGVGFSGVVGQEFADEGVLVAFYDLIVSR